MIIEVPMDLHNCFWKGEDTLSYARYTHSVRAFMRPLIEAISRKQPSWRFVSDRAGSLYVGEDSKEVRSHTYFIVEDADGEVLGSLWQDWRGQNDVYAFNNHRLDATRSRGRANITKDVNKAAKTITQNFFARTPREQLFECRSVVNQALGSASSRAYTERHKNLAPLQGKFTDWVSKPYAAEHLLNTVPEFRSLEEQLRLAPTLEEEHIAIREMQKASVGGYGVIQRGMTYYVLCGEEVTAYTEAALPDHIKGNVGMLKLVEDKTALPGIGVRASEHNYWVVPEEKPDE